MMPLKWENRYLELAFFNVFLIGASLALLRGLGVILGDSWPDSINPTIQCLGFQQGSIVQPIGDLGSWERIVRKGADRAGIKCSWKTLVERKTLAKTWGSERLLLVFPRKLRCVCGKLSVRFKERRGEKRNAEEAREQSGEVADFQESSSEHRPTQSTSLRTLRFDFNIPTGRCVFRIEVAGPNPIKLWNKSSYETLSFLTQHHRNISFLN